MDLDIKDDYESILRGWWIILLCALAGGLFGLVFSLNNPPIYEARSTIIVSSDYSSVNQKSWTDYKVDLVNNRGALLVNSNEIRGELLAEFNNKGVDIQSASLSLERKLSKWDLVIRHSNPQVAAEVANSWLDLALSVLNDARLNNLEVMEINLMLDELASCANDTTQNSFCSGITSGLQLSDEIKKLTTQLEVAERNSKGISLIMTFESGGEAIISPKPVLYDRNLLIFVGSIIGLLSGSLSVLYGRNLARWLHR